MLADRDDGARLRSLVAFLLIDGKPDFLADRQLGEQSVVDAVAVKIDLLTVRQLDKAEPLLREKTCDLAVHRGLMGLHARARAAHMVLESPPCGIKGIANGNVHVFMGVIFWADMPDGDLAPRGSDVDRTIVERSLVVRAVTSFDHDAATCNAWGEALQMCRLLADIGFD